MLVRGMSVVSAFRSERSSGMYGSAGSSSPRTPDACVSGCVWRGPAGPGPCRSENACSASFPDVLMVQPGGCRTTTHLNCSHCSSATRSPTSMASCTGHPSQNRRCCAQGQKQPVAGNVPHRLPHPAPHTRRQIPTNAHASRRESRAVEKPAHVLHSSAPHAPPPQRPNSSRRPESSTPPDWGAAPSRGAPILYGWHANPLASSVPIWAGLRDSTRRTRHRSQPPLPVLIARKPIAIWLTSKERVPYDFVTGASGVGLRTRVAHMNPREPDPEWRPIHPAHLTTHEREVVRCLCSGMSNSDIALHLGVAQSTIRSHIKHASCKVGALNRGHLIIYGFRTGLIDKSR